MYSYQPRNAKTKGEAIVQLREQQQNLAKQKQLNHEYDLATRGARDNQKLGITPLAPTFKTKDEAQTDIIGQRLQLQHHISTILKPSEAKKFMSRVFNDTSYILLINKYFNEIESELPKHFPISSSYLIAFLDKFFIVKQRMEGIDEVIQTKPYSEVERSIDDKALSSVDERLTGDELIRATRQLIKENYPNASGMDIDSSEYDPQILRFYVAHRVIPSTAKLDEKDWMQIYKYETAKTETIVKPYASFSKEKAPKESEQEKLLRQIKAEEAKKAAEQQRQLALQPQPPREITPTKPQPVDVVRRMPLPIGQGIQGHRRIKVGRGIDINYHDKEMPYIEFGRYILHVPSLKKQVLNIKHQSGGVIPSLPRQTMSSELTDLFLDLVENKKINPRIYDTLNDKDKQVFSNICFKAGIEETLGFGLKVPDDEKEEFNRFQLLRGEVSAGNNAPQVLRELKSYILKFMSTGRIRKNEGYEILAEISILT